MNAENSDEIAPDSTPQRRALSYLDGTSAHPLLTPLGVMYSVHGEYNKAIRIDAQVRAALIERMKPQKRS